MKLGEAIYKAQSEEASKSSDGGDQGPGGSAGDDIVDADFRIWATTRGTDPSGSG
jgi:hypothetical protein